MLDPAGDAGWQMLVELLVNYETSFFRHPPFFVVLTEYVLPELMCTANEVKTIDMWSAGCSMGQEAYSLARAFFKALRTQEVASLSDRYKKSSTGPWHVRGFDGSYHALHKARTGCYTWQEVCSLPMFHWQRYFTVVEKE